jgi:hypothetical protein
VDDKTKELRPLAEQLYDEVLRTSNYFLHNCKTFPLGILKGEDPSYSELALGMKRLAVVITLLAVDFDPMMGQKASEYCELMSQIGLAIEKSDEVSLQALVSELEKRPGT